jgi:hypothetical protein
MVQYPAQGTASNQARCTSSSTQQQTTTSNKQRQTTKNDKQQITTTTTTTTTAVTTTKFARMPPKAKKLTLEEIIRRDAARRLRRVKVDKKYYDKVVKAKREAQKPRKTVGKPALAVSLFQEPKLLEKFVMDTLLRKKIGKWKDSLDKHVRSFLTCRFPTKMGPTGPEIGGDEMEKARSIVISFFRKDNRMTDGGCCIDLFEVKKSNLANANNGLFALRPFKEGEVLGVFYGKPQRKNKKKFRAMPWKAKTIMLCWIAWVAWTPNILPILACNLPMILPWKKQTKKQDGIIVSMDTISLLMMNLLPEPLLIFKLEMSCI